MSTFTAAVASEILPAALMRGPIPKMMSEMLYCSFFGQSSSRVCRPMLGFSLSFLSP